MSALLVLRLAAEHLADYRAIRLVCLSDAPEAFGTAYEAEAAQPTEHFAGRLAANAIFGAYLDGTIVGTAMIARETGIKKRHKATLGGVYVAPHARGTGAARAIVGAALDHADTVVEQVLLTVVRSNERARRLYRGFGFTEYGMEPRSLCLDGTYYDQVLMIRFAGGAPAPSHANEG